MDDLERDNAKFYEKIRQSAQLLGPPSNYANRNITPNFGESSSSRAGKFFGDVTREQMESIMRSYEVQQSDENMASKPVACDADIIKGGSYAKMLYAKTGFHYLGSTDYLIKELGIDDETRFSFLGEYNTFAVADSENLDGIKREYTKAIIEKIIESANEQMNLKKMPEALDLIEQALKLDRKSGPARIAMGKYQEQQKNYRQAATEFREALNCSEVDEKQVRMNLSNALYQIGMGTYHRRQWKESDELFRQSLDADPDNQGARLHLELTHDHLKREHESQRSFRPAPPRHRG